MNISKLETLVLALLPTIVIAGILILRPHWGLMDDHYNIFIMLPGIEKTGILRAAWNYGVSDIAWGMFRPTYPILCWFLYSPGIALGPTATFLLNAVVSLLAIWYTARVFSRILGLRIEEVLIVNGAFFYQYDLFQHPSLQEKLVFATGAAFVAACWQKSSPRAWARIALWFLIGIGTKASFMIYFCLGYWALLASRETALRQGSKRAWIEAGALAVAGVALLGFYMWVSKQGAYTSKYFGNSIWPNLLSLNGAMFLIPVFTFLAAVLHTRAWRGQGLKIFLPTIGVLAFLALFARWGIAAYVQSLIGTVFCCLLVQNAQLYFARIPKAVWLVPISALALVVASYRTYGSFVRLHDVGAFIQKAPELGVKEISMPCDEGTIAMQRYLKAEGNSGVEVRHADASPDGKAWFFDRALCPLENHGDAPAGCTAEPLWAGLWQRSFRLSRMHCAQR